jgi:tRNA (guanine-N7-)-methyltransferase
MQSNSRRVTSSQTAPHGNLYKVVRKHLAHSYLKPLSKYVDEDVSKVLKTIEAAQRPVLLDSGCGTGESTLFLGRQNPSCLIIGIDKSAVRMQKALKKVRPENVIFLRTDQFNFWRTARMRELTFEKHFLYYPNPWPKKDHLMRRIHGHPAFSDLLWISKKMIIRSNWRLFLEEFAIAFEAATNKRGTIMQISAVEPVTLFEKKFLTSGHDLYEFTN